MDRFEDILKILAEMDNGEGLDPGQVQHFTRRVRDLHNALQLSEDRNDQLQVQLNDQLKALENRNRLESEPGPLVDSFGQEAKYQPTVNMDISHLDNRLQSQLQIIDAGLQDELDLEETLRSTLEGAIGALGITNVVVFLPSTMDEYTVGGYVNYDQPRDMIDSLLDSLADECGAAAETGDIDGFSQKLHLSKDSVIV